MIYNQKNKFNENKLCLLTKIVAKIKLDVKKIYKKMYEGAIFLGEFSKENFSRRAIFQGHFS